MPGANRPRVTSRRPGLVGLVGHACLLGLTRKVMTDRRQPGRIDHRWGAPVVDGPAVMSWRCGAG